MEITGLGQTEKHWDKLASDELKRDLTRKSWGGVKNVADNHNYLITGEASYYWIDYVRDKYFPGGYAGHTLSLGCGEGFIERLLKQRGFCFESITGVDLNEKCIEVARQRANEVNLAPRVDYVVKDLNMYSEPERRYNFIFFFHSLHHVRELEQILAGCRKALEANGFLMVNEFVGPSRFQWTQQQLREANALFKMLPRELRFDLTSQQVKEEITAMSVDEMIRHDESEAVRSSEIEKILKRNFDVIEEKNWGGTLINLIFDNTAGNYDPENAYHNTIADLLIHHENTLIEHGVLPSDFKFFMARPKKKWTVF